MPRLVSPAPLLPLLAGTLLAQQPAAPALATSSDTYTRIAAATELTDGSVILLDNRDRALWHLTSDLHQRTPVSRAGDGPGEFRTPWQVAQVGDTVVVWDLSLGRASRCTPPRDACVTLTLPFGHRYTELIGADARGGLFLSALRAQAERPRGDSLVVLRVHLPTSHVDTVALIADGPTYTMVRRAGGRTDRFIVPVPMVAGDQMGVTPDGALWVIPSTGSVLMRYLSKATSTTPISPAPTSVLFSPTERDSLLHIADSSGYGESLRANLPASKGAVAPRRFLVGPDGHFWVGFNRTTGGANYEVLSPRGRRLGIVPVPIGGRLVGVGAKRYYVAIADADELETLYAYPVPSFAKGM